MKVLFLSDNFPPEYNAPASRTFEHCREWVALGAEVVVVTCAPNFPKGVLYPGYKNKFFQKEIVDGITVIRVWSYISANHGIVRRTIDFVSFAFTSFLAGLFIKCDIIVATSPQFFTAVSGCAVGLLRRKPWVMEVRDIWPESITAVEVVDVKWIISFLEKVELFLYWTASKVIVVTDSFKENLIRRGVHREKIYVVKNGVDLSIYKPQPKNQSLTGSLGLNGKFVVGYIGTHGLAHSLEFIVRSIKKLNDPSIQFLFIGDGAEKKHLVEVARQLDMPNVSFIEPVKKSEIGNYLSVLDVALVPLKKSTTFESVIPSKIFETTAMHIPILLGVDGESRKIIESYNSGMYFEPENESAFIQTCLDMRAKLQVDKDFFKMGCQKMADAFNRKSLAKEMLAILSVSNS